MKECQGSNPTDFEIWKELFDLYCELNNIKGNEKKALLLTHLGIATYQNIRALTTPKKPNDLSYDELVKVIQNHLNPKPLVAAERSRFRGRLQTENETVSEYIVALKKLTAYCVFGDGLEEAWRDQIVHGIRDQTLKKKLFDEPDLTYQSVVKIVNAWEATRLSMEAEKKLTAQSVNYVQKKERREQSNSNWRTRNNQSSNGDKNPKKQTDNSRVPAEKKKCTCCGYENHEFRNCKFKNATCHICKRSGHLASVCFNRSQNGHKRNKKKEQVNTISDAIGDEVFLQNMFSVDSNDSYSEQTFLEVFVNTQKLKMEVDNGSAITAISEKLFQEKFNELELHFPNSEQVAYDGTRMKTIGYIEVSAQIEGNTAQKLRLFVVKDGGQPLIGREWFKPPGIAVKVDVEQIKTIGDTGKEEILSSLLKEFNSLFTRKRGEYKYAECDIELKDGAKPRFFRPRPLPLALQDKVSAEIDRLGSEGIYKEVRRSEFATPIVVVPKSDGSIRICGDYKVSLNPLINIDRYPLPKPDELFSKIANSKYFTKIDLSHAYQGIRVSESLRKLLTLSTHRGLFEPQRLMFGIASAPAIFQREIESLLCGINKTVCFLDDILIGGKAFSEHVKAVREVLTRLLESGLTINLLKCRFFVEEVTYLGFRLTLEGIFTDSTKVDAIVKTPYPSSKTELQAFLGMISHIIKFLPRSTEVLYPLYELLKKEAKFELTKRHKKAIDEVKKLVLKANCLAHFDPTKPVILRCDASPNGIGGVLFHKIGNKELPIAYVSRTLNNSEKNYAQIDREALAIVFCVQKFEKYLYGLHFILETDNRALSFIFGGKNGLSKIAAARVQRYGVFLNLFDFEICHIPASKNTIADGLSRLPLVSEESPERINFVSEIFSKMNQKVVAEETAKDLVLKEVYCKCVAGWPEIKVKKVPPELKTFFLKPYELHVEGGCLFKDHKLIIPTTLRKVCLKELHLSHFGVSKMKSLAREHFWWPQMDKEIENLTSNCEICLRNRKNPPQTILHKWKYPKRQNARFHADFGELGKHVFLLITDQFSKWVEVYWLTSTTSKVTIKCLRDYFSRWGIAELLVTDNGPQFVSEEMEKFLAKNGVQHLTTGAWHPQSNGAAENAVGNFKDKINKMLSEGQSLEEATARYLLDYRTSDHITTGKPPSELQLGRKLRTRFDVLLQKKEDREKTYFKGTRTVGLDIGDDVLVRNYVPNKEKWERGQIIEKSGEVTVEVELADGSITKRHADQILKAPLTEIPENEKPTSTVEAEVESQSGEMELEPVTAVAEATQPELRCSGRSNKGNPPKRLNL